MTALGIRYLTGYAVAANLAAPRTPEFPPHFGRVFMAMAATYFETRGTDEERRALEWLESAGAPSISASEGNPRSFVETYVPVNDKHGGITTRSRQPRSFPTMRPDHPFVYLVWHANVPQGLRNGLQQLCEKVTRIGHSSSLVQMWMADDSADFSVTWQPGENGGERQMRTVEEGTLAYLERAFNGQKIQEYCQLAEALETATGKRKSQFKKEIAERFPEGQPESQRPILTKWQGYVRAASQKPEGQLWRGAFDPQLIVVTRRDDQRVMGIESTLQLTSALRDAAMKSAGANVPEWLSGHQADGSPTLQPHAAFFSLPFVGAKYADAHVMGLAIAIPRIVSFDDVRKAFSPLLFRETGEEKGIVLWRGNQWRWEGEREKREYPPVTLRTSTWVGPALDWASVTPIVLHHYPKKKRDGDVERILIEAFESAGLPQPAELCAQPVSWFEGAGHAMSMPDFTEGGEKLCRYQTHVVVKFSTPVEGPVLVGRGRFRGYGLMRPVEVQRG